MKISMIVCTRNRASRLPRFLSALAALDPVPFGWGLLIVDHASIDDTESIIREFAASAAFPVRALRAAAGPLSAAKNQAIAAARGEIVALTDDDCYPRSDYLGALADAFQASDVGVIGGRVVRHDPSDANVSIAMMTPRRPSSRARSCVRGPFTERTLRCGARSSPRSAD